VCSVNAQLQKTLEDVRSNQFQNTPADLKHLDAVYGDGGVSLAPSFDRFQTTELSLKVDEETYSYNADAFFQVNQGLLPDLVHCALANAKGEAALDLYCVLGCLRCLWRAVSRKLSVLNRIL
jgi:tRNA/tmRNA/rRNA uracil-C5-methylase (TrmA/RlmC/RlmD family)